MRITNVRMNERFRNKYEGGERNMGTSNVVPMQINAEEMSIEQLQAMQNQLTNIHLRKITEELEEIKDRQVKHEEQTKYKLNEIEQLAKDSLRARQPKQGWMTLRDFGGMFETTISSHRVGKLLRAAGLAIRGKRKTVPYRKHTGKERFCQSNVYEGYSSYVWNYNRCMTYIDLWLERVGEFSQFYALVASGDETALAAYIDKLHDRYGRS